MNIKIEKAIFGHGNDHVVGDIFEIGPTDNPKCVKTYEVISIEGDFLNCKEIELQEINTSYATELEVVE